MACAQHFIEASILCQEVALLTSNVDIKYVSPYCFLLPH